MPTVNSGVSVHEIDLRGRAGAMFSVAAISCVLIIVGYATSGWSMYDNGVTKMQYGLWETCACITVTNTERKYLKNSNVDSMVEEHLIRRGACFSF